MAATRLHVYSTERLNEVIRRIRIWSDSDRLKSAMGGYLVKVGVAKGTKTFWLGQWNQASQTLKAREYVDLTGIADLNWPLEPGSVCVIEIHEQGVTGQNTLGLAIEMKFSRVGGTSKDPIGARLDDNQFSKPRSVSPLFSLGRHIEDADIRAAVEPIEEDLNTSGVTEWVLTTQFPAIGGAEQVEFAELFEEDEEYGVFSHPYGMAQIGGSITLTLPDPAVPYRLHAAYGVAADVHGVPPPGQAHGEVQLIDLISGTVVHPAPQAGLQKGLALGSYASQEEGAYSNASGANVGWVVPAGQATVVLAVRISVHNGDMEFHDPWISARLYRDPYAV